MLNILLSEWRAQAAALAAEAAPMFPGVRIVAEGLAVRLESSGALGAVEPDVGYNDGATPRFRVDAPSIQGGRGLAALLAHADTLRRLAEAATWLEARCEGVTVWYRDAPCGFCSGRGESMGKPCGHCGGAGKRNEVEAA